MTGERLQNVITKLKQECPHYRIGQAIVNSIYTDKLEDNNLTTLFYMKDSILLSKLEEHMSYVEMYSKNPKETKDDS